MIRVKNDGNGGTLIENIRPAWVAVIIAGLTLSISIGSYVFGKGEKIATLEKQMIESQANHESLKTIVMETNADVKTLMVEIDWIKKQLDKQP